MQKEKATEEHRSGNGELQVQGRSRKLNHDLKLNGLSVSLSFDVCSVFFMLEDIESYCPFHSLS